MSQLSTPTEPYSEIQPRVVSPEMDTTILEIHLPTPPGSPICTTDYLLNFGEVPEQERSLSPSPPGDN